MVESTFRWSDDRPGRLDCAHGYHLGKGCRECEEHRRIANHCTEEAVAHYAALADAAAFEIPTPAQVLADPSAHVRLKLWLTDALKLDPIDAANDAELLAAVLGARADRILAGDKP